MMMIMSLEAPLCDHLRLERATSVCRSLRGSRVERKLRNFRSVREGLTESDETFSCLIFLVKKEMDFGQRNAKAVTRGHLCRF
jgi:hypothetical protein